MVRSRGVRKVLVVEDDGTEMILVRVACRSLPWSVRIVDSPITTLAALSTASPGLDGETWSTPDLVIVDLNLGAHCGIELLRELAVHPVLRGVPLLSWSGHAHPSLSTMAKQAGALEFSEKPLHLEKLTATLRAFDSRWINRLG